MPRRLPATLLLAAGLAAPVPRAAADEPDKKYPEFATVVKGAKVTEGLFTLHQKDDHLFAELQPQHFDKPYLLPIAVAKGAGMGGSTLNFGDEWVVLFKRHGEKVFLVRRNVRFTAKAGTPAAKAVDTTYADSVLMALPVKTLNPAKGSVVIDLNPVFFSDFAELGLGMLDRERTTWHKVTGFKKNLELQVAATFSGGRAGRGFHGSDDVIDGRGITVVVQYGIVELPDGGYHPRYADNRVGHFLTAVKDFSKDNPDTSFVRMVNRWRLERADGSPWKDGAKLVPPKKKIIYWIEDSVPDEYRAAVREGILEWNKAFEKIGFRDAIEVRQQQGEEFDPEDVSYATFRWTSTDVASAIGPSRANPLTGEIIDADILFDGSFIRYYKEEQKVYRDETGRPVEPASAIQAARRGWEVPAHPLAHRGPAIGWNERAGDGAAAEAREWAAARANAQSLCRCATHRRGELALAVTHLMAVVGAKDGEKVPDELLQQAVKETTMHEVGHTLGLRHNFKASTMLPNSKLHDTAVTRKQGLVGSVMDYAPANIAPKGVPQGDYFTTTLGPYDYWAIEYAYKPIGGGTDGEADELKKVAQRGAEADLTFATDEDLRGGPDPFVNVWDLGADPLQFGKDRIKLAQDMVAAMGDKVVDKGESYARLRRAFALMLRQYGDAAELAARQVGGVSVNRDHKGDPNGRDPLVPVKGDKQREALRFLRDDILTDKPFDFPPALLRKLTADKWLHWGTPFGGGGEFPVNERVLAIQRVALDELLDADTLGRVQNAARSAGPDDKPVTLAEIFRCLTDGVFAGVPGADEKSPAAVKSSVVSRNLQRAYVAKLSELVLGPKGGGGGFMLFLGRGPGGVPADARSLARMHLREVGTRVDAALKAEKDDTARAHLEETKERVAKVLAANVTANEP